MFGSGSAWGNADLWVGGLGDGGVIDARPVFVADDGSIGWKLGSNDGIRCSAIESGVQPSLLSADRIGRFWENRKISFARTENTWPDTWWERSPSR